MDVLSVTRFVCNPDLNGIHRAVVEAPEPGSGITLALVINRLSARRENGFEDMSESLGDFGFPDSLPAVKGRERIFTFTRSSGSVEGDRAGGIYGVRKMADWGFYGRNDDMERLRDLLGFHFPKDSGRFDYCYHVIGPRRVGKTELLSRTMERFGGDARWVRVSVDRGNDAGECLRRLRVSVNRAGGDLLEAMPDPDPEGGAAHGFVETVRHLLHRGVVVSVDEFQRCAENGIIGWLVPMVDDMKIGEDPLRKGESWGTLVLLGSHQQRMLEIVGGTGEMCDRSRLAVNLRPWRLRTVLEMATRHGLLARPGRFLTLWSAYSGVPGHWQRFVTGHDGARLRDFLETPDDDAWRRNFLSSELRRLEDPEERFDSRSWMTLKAKLRQVVLLLGMSAPKGGLTAAEIVGRLRGHASPTLVVEGSDGDPKPVAGEIDEALDRLRSHLELVAWSTPFLSRPGRAKWRIQDPGSLFQLRVFPELFERPGTIGSGDGGSGVEIDPDVAMARLLDLEGHMLERLSAYWIDGWGRDGPEDRRVTVGDMRFFPWVRHGVDLGGRIEVDVVAVVNDPDRGAVAALASCKRDAAAHRPGKALEIFDGFVEKAGEFTSKRRNLWRWPAVNVSGAEGPEGPWPGRSFRRQLLVSPEFSETRRAALSTSGIECFDIRDMALGMGLVPGPLAGPAADEDPELAKRVRT